MHFFREIKGDSLVDTKGGFQDITSPKEITTEKADSFWKKEFDNVAESIEVSPYDMLISEVFNCSEADLDIPVDIDESLQSSLEKFKAEQWNELTSSEKEMAIDHLENDISRSLGLKDAPKIAYFSDEGGDYGQFDSKTGTININRCYMDNPYELVDTIAHETRHAYQRYRAGLLETHQDALYRVNFDNYITPVELPAGGYLMFMDYWDQYVEVDARVFASKITEAI